MLNFQRSGFDAPAFILDSAPVTGRIRLVALRAYYAWRGTPDPTAGMKVKRPKRAPRKPFTAEELHALLAACTTPREQALILCFAATGARLSEITGMSTEDLAGDGMLKIFGKGSRERWVYIGKAAFVALARYLDGREGAVWLADEPHTRREYRDGPMSPRTVFGIIKRIGRRAGVTGVHPHRFRTTYACQFLEESGDGGALQIVLGHSTLAQTMEYAAYGAAKRALMRQRELSLADRL